MYLKRKIDSFLKDWKEYGDRKPLIIKGPRQIGKTESIRHFAETNYESIVEINFVTDPKYRMITEDGYGADAIIRNISLLNNEFRFIPGHTLLFFDEIQKFPDIATSLKFFKEDGRYDVVCSGSLLGINYQEIESNSVGFKDDYDMYSMDFEEFLWAKGYQNEMKDELLSHMVQLTPLSSVERTVWSSLFMDYCILGGMPAVVKSYIEKGTFEGILTIQRQLLLDYEEDIMKYTEGLEKTRTLSVYRSIPAQLAKENKKFQYSKVARSARAREYQGCVEWLENSGIVKACHCMNFPELPVKGNLDPDVFKLYYCDTGLLVASLDEESQEDLRANRNFGVYKGALYENIAAEALYKSGAVLCYYRKEDGTLEEDFFIRNSDSLIPVEVKAQKGNSSSLSRLINDEKYSDIHFGVKLHAGNIGDNEHIFTFPWYCAFLLREWARNQAKL